MNIEDIKILVIDDNESVARITGQVLADELKCNILVSSKPESAFQILQKGDTAILLSDLAMPGYDGNAVLEYAYSCNPSTKSILITAHATRESLIKAINFGHVWYCIEKPWSASQLATVVRQAIEAYMKQVAPPSSIVKTNISGIRASRKNLATGRARSKIMIRKKTAATQNKAVASMSMENAYALLEQEKRYSNVSFLKQGGSGFIFKAHDDLLKMSVAIKILYETFASHEKSVQALSGEASVAMQLSHKHIVRLHNLLKIGKTYCLVMEYIEGSNLRELLNKLGALPMDMIVQIFDICEDAIGYAHRHGIFHRDIKPDNFMVSHDGVLKIIDFGLASLAEDEDEIAGTPYYMSPEEINKYPIDQRSDVYSFAVMMHELITGSLPISPDKPLPDDILDFVPEVIPELPAHLHHVIEKGFAQKPDERWQDMHEFAEAFRHALKGNTETTPPPKPTTKTEIL